MRVVLAAGQPPGGDAGTTEAVGDGRQGESGEAAGGGDAERRKPGGGIRIEGQAVDRKRRQEGCGSVRLDHVGTAGTRLAGGRLGDEPARPGAHTAARGQRGGHGVEQAQRPAVQAHQAVGGEERPAGGERLHGCAHVLQAGQQRLGCLLDGAGVGSDQPQPGAAGDRLADAHAGSHAEGRGGGVRLADPGRAAGLGRERHRHLGQAAAVGERHPQGEAGDEHADDGAVGAGHRGGPS